MSTAERELEWSMMHKLGAVKVWNCIDNPPAATTRTAHRRITQYFLVLTNQ